MKVTADRPVATICESGTDLTLCLVDWTGWISSALRLLCETWSVEAIDRVDAADDAF